MARQGSRSNKEQKLMRTWWVCGLLFLAFIGLAYGFVSLALDSGQLWQYAVALLFIVWGINNLVKSIRFFSWHHR